MTANFPGTFEVRINYVSDEPAAVAQHQLRFSMEMATEANPGDPFTEWAAAQRGGGTITLDEVVDDMILLLQPIYSTAVDFTDAELWEYEPGTFNAVYRAGYAIAENGTGTGTITGGQLVLTFRTSGGGIAKLDLRASIQPAGVTLSYPTSNSIINAIMAYLALANTWFVGRDGNYVIAALKAHPGLNEHTFKEINR